MSFKINIKNSGATSTVKVYQKINLGEETEIYNDIVESGKSVEATAYSTEDNGDSGGEFAWKHVGSGLTGQEYVDAGGEILVND